MANLPLYAVEKLMFDHSGNEPRLIHLYSLSVSQFPKEDNDSGFEDNTFHNIVKRLEIDLKQMQTHFFLRSWTCYLIRRHRVTQKNT